MKMGAFKFEERHFNKGERFVEGWPRKSQK